MGAIPNFYIMFRQHRFPSNCLKITNNQLYRNAFPRITVLSMFSRNNSCSPSKNVELDHKKATKSKKVHPRRQLCVLYWVLNNKTYSCSPDVSLMKTFAGLLEWQVSPKHSWLGEQSVYRFNECHRQVNWSPMKKWGLALSWLWCDFRAALVLIFVFRVDGFGYLG